MNHQVTAALPGYFMLTEWKMGPEKAEAIIAEPIVAWGHSRHEDDSEWQDASPICIDMPPGQFAAILTPAGLVYQAGNKKWLSIGSFMDDVYGSQLPVHGI